MLKESTGEIRLFPNPVAGTDSSSATHRPHTGKSTRDPPDNSVTRRSPRTNLEDTRVTAPHRPIPNPGVLAHTRETLKNGTAAISKVTHETVKDRTLATLRDTSADFHKVGPLAQHRTGPADHPSRSAARATKVQQLSLWTLLLTPDQIGHVLHQILPPRTIRETRFIVTVVVLQPRIRSKDPVLPLVTTPVARNRVQRLLLSISQTPTLRAYTRRMTRVIAR